MSGELGVESAYESGYGGRISSQGQRAFSEEDEAQCLVDGHVGAVGHGGVLGSDPRPQEADETHDLEVTGAGHHDGEGEDVYAD